MIRDILSWFTKSLSKVDFKSLRKFLRLKKLKTEANQPYATTPKSKLKIPTGEAL